MGSQHLKPLARIQNGIRDDDPVCISFERTGKALFALNHKVLWLKAMLTLRGSLISTNSLQDNLGTTGR